MLKLPKVGTILRAAATARFARALALLMSSGVSLLAALPLAASVADVVVEEQSSRAVEGLKAGLRLDQSLAVLDYFPRLVLEMLRVGQETGFPASLLNWLASQDEQELEYALDAFRSSMEPLLTAFVGSLVLVAALLPPVRSSTVVQAKTTAWGEYGGR